jgi:hypothetical protein
MVYTPPRYSDHIAVAVNLAESLPLRDLSKDAKTKGAQPHRTYKAITNFFGTVPQSASPPIEEAKAEPARVLRPAEPVPEVPATPTKAEALGSTEPTQAATRFSAAAGSESTAKARKSKKGQGEQGSADAIGKKRAGPLDKFMKKAKGPNDGATIALAPQ